MEQLLNLYLNTSAYSNRSDRLRVTIVYGLLFMVTIMLLILSVIGNIAGIALASIAPFIGIAITLGVYVLVRQGYFKLGSWILLIGMASISVSANLPDGILMPRQILNVALLILMGGFLLETPGIVLFGAVAIGQTLLFPAINGYLDTGNYEWPVRLTLSTIYVVIGLMVYAYNQFVAASQIKGQTLESQERIKLAEVNMYITQQASTRQSLDSALNTTLQLILQNYPQMYHAQIFLLDNDGIQARLSASTGEAGQKLIERSHSLAVGSLSVIGQTTLTGEPVIALSSEKDGVHRTNELLPDTTLEAAFPLRVGTRIIGALDLQSKTLTELNRDDRLTFQSLANSLSLAIDSIQQFEQAQAQVEENQRLAEQTRSALREVERLNQRLIGRAWSEHIQHMGEEPGIAIDFSTNQSEAYHAWTEGLLNATEQNQIVQMDNVIAVPLRVRGQVVGAMEFELDEAQHITQEDLELLLEVSERFGLAAENTRLVEESRRTAQRETLINQITSRFQSAQNVEATLAEAARSIGDTLSAEKVMIRLGAPDRPSKSNGKDS
ncbi:MAG: GAF domain-containing protein [Anaerolineae bacterium]